MLNKVKIQRKKRDHKKVTVKEKILTALGLGSAFVGMSAAGASQSKNPIVRTINKANPLAANKVLAADAEVETEDTAPEDPSPVQPVEPPVFYTNTANAADTGGIRGPDIYAANNDITVVENLDLSAEHNDTATVAPPVAAPRTVRQVRPARAPLESDQSYTVVKGDTLWDLAVEYYGDGTKWHKILEANPGKIPGDNPRLLQIGTVLVIPKI